MSASEGDSLNIFDFIEKLFLTYQTYLKKMLYLGLWLFCKWNYSENFADEFSAWFWWRRLITHDIALQNLQKFSSGGTLRGISLQVSASLNFLAAKAECLAKHIN